MRWFDTPPCVPLEISEASPTRLVLKGPTRTSRISNGTSAAMGGLFAGVGLRMLRMPLPAPFKLLPLGFTAMGAGMLALSGTAALVQCTLEADRKGLTQRWKLPGLPERTTAIAAADVAGFEVSEHSRSTRDAFGESQTVYEHRLMVITRGGQALALEPFLTHTQAELRQKELTARLGGEKKKRA